MPPFWWKLLKIMLLLFALFTTFVSIAKCQSDARREAEAEANSVATRSATAATNNSSDLTPFLSDNLLNIMRNRSQQQQPQPRDESRSHAEEEEQQQTGEVELPAEDIEQRVRSIFKVHDGDGVMIFNTTTTDDAPFMPSISTTMLGDQPASSDTWPYSQSESESETESQAETNAKPKHYHQYQSLNHQQQSFKVQRSPDGKLNLVFNDPLVSLQTTTQQQHHQQPSTTHHQQQQPFNPQLQRPTPRRPISDNKYRTTTPPPPPSIDTGDHQCVDGFNQSRSFCTKVHNYPDLSGLKVVLANRFANFFSDEPQPTDVGLRINDDEQYLCNSHVRYLYPKLGQRLDLSWQIIVNTDDFKQGILIEECDHEGESCQFLDSFPNNYVPVCKQHYVIRHLATVNNASNGQPEVANEPFKIPSCCKCVIKSKFSGDSSP
ncbi:protein spaetzle isoform X2 [Drosophila albomicans]|uniref:Protein spaetzle isoform X2 n=1 Tax=Drosophila albomicans TaxID=7291 RepID=A0A9C6T182_DROAB|nr:protein spaetzle isoform X2 [Drosophila albomicans]